MTDMFEDDFGPADLKSDDLFLAPVAVISTKSLAESSHRSFHEVPFFLEVIVGSLGWIRSQR